MLRVRRPQGSIKRTVDAISQRTRAFLGSADALCPFGLCGLFRVLPVDFLGGCLQVAKVAFVYMFFVKFETDEFKIVYNLK